LTVRTLNGGIIAAYRDRLPIPPDVEAIHISEGDTPLVHLPAVSDRKRNIDVYAKCEGLNPTGSFKDRGMTVALSMASIRIRTTFSLIVVNLSSSGMARDI